jgi:prepilin-type N-terminal cleavage/methylation domain-containing protein
MPKSDKGFSLIEVLMVVAIILIGASVAIVQMRSSMAIVDADKAINTVASQLKYARQIAVDQRRDVLVEFVDNNKIRITRQDIPTPTIVSEVVLPPGFTFSLPMGVGDTPDGYGNALPVTFNSSPSGTFLGDGVFVSATGIVTNGSVFTMGGGTGTARAITLTGASGRTRIYLLDGSSWTERI